MASSFFPSLLLVCALCFIENPTRVFGRTLSEQEDIELENQLRLLNKPAVTTISTKYGEEYDCIDFYKQPAFDHPALKSHNFHPKMKFNGRRNKIDNEHFSSLWLNGKGCPTGTVPIKRSTKEDLIRIKLATEIYEETYKPMTAKEPGTHYAVVHTDNAKKKKYYGARMQASVYNISDVRGAQYSSGLMKIANGADSLEVGWTVNPSLYNDGETRLFIYTHTATSHCFNTYCPGFVVVRTDVPVDEIISPVSKRGSSNSAITVSIYKESGNWVLAVGLNDTIEIGFWPQRIFTGMKDTANYVEWGGKVYSPTNVPSPPMGSGRWDLTEDVFEDAYCRRLAVVDESHAYVNATEVLTYTDIQSSYDVVNKGYVDPFNGCMMFYGGEGGHRGN